MNKKRKNKYKNILRKLDGGRASFAMYTDESINILLVNVSGIAKGMGNSIGFTECTFIKGPTIWDNIKIDFEENKLDSNITVTDERVGFYVKCSNIYIDEDIEEILYFPSFS